MVHDVSEAQRPPRWLGDSALARSPARVPGDHSGGRGRGAAPWSLLGGCVARSDSMRLPPASWPDAPHTLPTGG